MIKIAIDPGHGGKDPGAVGPGGVREKDINLQVALRTADILEDKGHQVFLTRDTDKYLGLTERASLANAWGAHVYLSIHCNAAENRQAVGFEVWTSVGKTKSDVVAGVLYNVWAKRFPENALRNTKGGQGKERNFTVLTKTNMPAVLVELDFISNPAMEAWLSHPGIIEEMARVLAEALDHVAENRLL